MLVGSDMLTDKNFPATARGKGDAFMIVGATLYGFSKRTLLYFNVDHCLQSFISQPMPRRNFLLGGLRCTRYFPNSPYITISFYFIFF